MSRVLLLLPLLLSLACGYRLLNAEGVPALRLGLIEDQSGEGDLGHQLAASLRRGLKPAEAPILKGHLRLRERPLAYDHRGISGAHELELELEVWYEQGAQRWDSGPLRQTGHYLRGASLRETRAARRLALESLTEALAQHLLEHLTLEER